MNQVVAPGFIDFAYQKETRWLPLKPATDLLCNGLGLNLGSRRLADQVLTISQVFSELAEAVGTIQRRCHRVSAL